MIKIFVDANVLYSNAIRSLFIWLNTNDAIKIYWSMEAWEEVFAAYAKHHSDVDSNKFRAAMMEAVAAYPECLVQTVRSPIPVGLKDAKDEHIVAAAVECGADYVVTNDGALLDEDLTKLDLITIKPDDMMMVLAEATSLAVVQGVRDHVASLQKSRPSIATYLQGLRNAGIEKFADWLERRRKAKKLFPELW